MRSLNQLKLLRDVLIRLRWLYLRHVWGMDIDRSASLSLSARLDRTYPRGVHIGANSYVAFEATILTHDFVRRLYCDTYVGRNCFIGARSMILPGVRVGDGSIVGAGSVVTRDVPPRSIVAGNPAKIVRSQIDVGRFGQLIEPQPTEFRDAG